MQMIENKCNYIELNEINYTSTKISQKFYVQKKQKLKKVF